MTQSTILDLETLARDAAQEIAGADVVEQVEVVASEDSTDRPVYWFWFASTTTSCMNVLAWSVRGWAKGSGTNSSLQVTCITASSGF